MIRSILVPVRGDGMAATVLAHAAQLAKQHDAKSRTQFSGPERTLLWSTRRGIGVAQHMPPVDSAFWINRAVLRSA